MDMFIFLPGHGSSSCRFRETKLKWMQFSWSGHPFLGHLYVAQKMSWREKEFSRTSVCMFSLWISLNDLMRISSYLVIIHRFLLGETPAMISIFYKRDSVEAEANSLGLVLCIQSAGTCWASNSKSPFLLRTAGTVSRLWFSTWTFFSFILTSCYDNMQCIHIYFFIYPGSQRQFKV